MVIQTERIWLFETSLVDPFIFEKTDGVDITMSESNDRAIQLLDIDKSIFFIDTVLKGGLVINNEYGGEDFLPNTNNGKNSNDYELSFNVPLDDQNLVEQLVGKEFSVIGMKRDLSLFVSFSRFVANNFDQDNEILGRITYTSTSNSNILYDVTSLNVTEVINIIGEQPAIYPPPFDNAMSIEYPIESLIN